MSPPASPSSSPDLNPSPPSKISDRAALEAAMAGAAGLVLGRVLLGRGAGFAAGSAVIAARLIADLKNSKTDSKPQSPETPPRSEEEMEPKSGPATAADPLDQIGHASFETPSIAGLPEVPEQSESPKAAPFLPPLVQEFPPVQEEAFFAEKPGIFPQTPMSAPNAAAKTTLPPETENAPALPAFPVLTSLPAFPESSVPFTSPPPTPTPPPASGTRPAVPHDPATDPDPDEIWQQADEFTESPSSSPVWESFPEKESAILTPSALKTESPPLPEPDPADPLLVFAEDFADPEPPAVHSLIPDPVPAGLQNSLEPIALRPTPIAAAPQIITPKPTERAAPPSGHAPVRPLPLPTVKPQETPVAALPTLPATTAPRLPKPSTLAPSAPALSPAQTTASPAPRPFSWGGLLITILLLGLIIAAVLVSR